MKFINSTLCLPFKIVNQINATLLVHDVQSVVRLSSLNSERVLSNSYSCTPNHMIVKLIVYSGQLSPILHQLMSLINSPYRVLIFSISFMLPFRPVTKLFAQLDIFVFKIVSLIVVTTNGCICGNSTVF